MAKRKSFADDGWAIWVTGDDTSSIYLNQWVNPKGKSFVDLGIRIRGIKSTQMLCVYVPFALEKEEIEDISFKLRDLSIFRAVFNTTGIIDYCKNRCCSEIAYNGRALDLVHISATEHRVEPMGEGSFLSVSLEALQEYLDNDEGYFLFRLPHKSLDEVFTKPMDVSNIFTRLRDLLTSPVVSEKYGCSVRINEARMLPNEITRRGSFHRQKLKKTSVTIAIHEDYQLNDRNCYRIHRVEENLYRDYAPGCFDCDDSIMYHWVQTRETNLRGHFNFYFDISHEAVSRLSMCLYMVLILLVGLVSDILWQMISVLLGL